MSLASPEVGRRSARRVSFARLAAAAPVVTVVAGLALVYLAEASGHHSPTLFSDELQWTQYARGVADHGFASIRGQRVSFQSLYVYLIAPAWRLGGTGASYDLVKALNVLYMTAAAAPAYLLARRLVSKPAAVLVAAASIAIPAMVYSLYILTEVVGYPWAVLCSWLIVEALTVRTRSFVAAAVIASLLAPFFRAELVVMPLAFAAAAFVLWWRSPSARRLRGPSWVRGDTIGLALLAFGLFVVAQRVLLHSPASEWRIATDLTSHIGLHVIWAAGALAIGLGVLPVVAGLTGLVPRRRERLLPHDEPFIALCVCLFALLALYTGIKGAYNEVTFSTRIDERNLFYGAPLLFVGSAIALERRRIRLDALAVSAVFAAYAIVKTPIQLAFPYFDAPGFSVAALANRHWAWSATQIEHALLVTLAVSVGVLLAVRYRPRVAGGRAALAAVALLVIAWNLAGEITAAVGANDTARTYVRNLPQPPGWIQQATGGRTVTYLGQAITSGDALRTNLLEFWNPAIVRVWTTDGSLIFPGPTFTPHLVAPDGTLSDPPGTPYLLADSGIVPMGTPVAKRGVLRLYPLHGPVRLRQALEGVDEEGWMQTSSAYDRFSEPRRGTLVVDLSRTSFCPPPSAGPPSPHVKVTVGELVLGTRNGQPNQPLLGKTWGTRSTVVPNCRLKQLRIPVGRGPWRAEVQLDHTFKPSDYGLSDTRVLGVMTAFHFIPAKGSA